MKKTAFIAAWVLLGIVLYLRFDNANDRRVKLAPKPRQLSENYQNFIALSSKNFGDQFQALDRIESNWEPGNAIMLLETARFIKDVPLRQQVFKLLETKTGEAFGDAPNRWYEWIWNQDYSPATDYAKFKRVLYSGVDPSFEDYFHQTESALIRLDEIRWGNVARDGIPPLNYPKYVSVADANYLNDSDIVFGVALRRADRPPTDEWQIDEVKCFPKRILAWHEMFKDTIGGQPVCGVY